MSAKLAALAKQVVEAARLQGLSLVTAESCTAGKLSNVLSEVPGAGEHLHGGFVTYTKEAKTELLGVSSELLRQRGGGLRRYRNRHGGRRLAPLACEHCPRHHGGCRPRT